MPVKFRQSGSHFGDGGSRINCPIREVVNEVGRIWPDLKRDIGCLVSIGTGWMQTSAVPIRLDHFLRKSVEMMNNSENIAESFRNDPTGQLLAASDRYFRFNVEQGMQNLSMDEPSEMDTMQALTDAYLGRAECASKITRCATRLLSPDEG